MYSGNFNFIGIRYFIGIHCLFRYFFLKCLRPHCIGFLLQSSIIVHAYLPFQQHRRLHASLFLLHHMPGLVRQVLLLPRRYVNIRALCVGMGLELRRLIGIIMHLHVIQRVARQVFYARFQLIG